MEPLVTLDVEIWADADGNPVAFGDVRGRSVLHGVGARVSPDVASTLLRAVQVPTKAIHAPAEDKAILSPARTKRGAK